MAEQHPSYKKDGYEGHTESLLAEKHKSTFESGGGSIIEVKKTEVEEHVLKRRNSVTHNKSKFETGAASNSVPAYKSPDVSIAKGAKGLQLKQEYEEGTIRNSEASIVLSAVSEAKEEGSAERAVKAVAGNGRASGNSKLDKKAEKAAAKQAEKQRKAEEKQHKKEEKARKKSK